MALVWWRRLGQSPTMTVRRIMVGVDGSEHSQQALSWAAALAVSLRAELLAVHAVGLLEHVPTDGEQPRTGSQGDHVVRVFEDDWCASLDAVDGLRSRRLVEEGPPTMVLLRLADREDVDLIVVGSRGVGGFDELLLGSTSMQLVQYSPVPVTVIPRRADETGT